MHAKVLDFINRMSGRCPKGFEEAKRVLEYGSCIVNGSPRKFFELPIYAPVTRKVEYVGVDWRPGPGVDVVSLMHGYKGKPNGYFDFAISTETLEHDPLWQSSLRRVVGLLGKGGCLLITCAGPGRHAHDVGTSPGKNYYANLSMPQLASSIFALTTFKAAYLEDDAEAHDLRFFGWRKRG